MVGGEARLLLCQCGGGGLHLAGLQTGHRQTQELLPIPAGPGELITKPVNEPSRSFTVPGKATEMIEYFRIRFGLESFSSNLEYSDSDSRILETE